MILPIAVIIFTAIDVGRTGQVQNRLTNAARAGGAVAQTTPGWVDPGCHGAAGIEDAVRRHDPGLGSEQDFSVSVETSDGTPITGCVDDVATTYDLHPGDEVVVIVTASIDMSTPAGGMLLGDPKHMTARYEVVVQG
ncbi:MAG: hypothetical protein KF906_10775 [Actinobacteria bacterium]|nr:hypothetical protein [Actinomycetota bacterium]